MVSYIVWYVKVNLFYADIEWFRLMCGYNIEVTKMRVSLVTLMRLFKLIYYWVIVEWSQASNGL